MAKRASARTSARTSAQAEPKAAPAAPRAHRSSRSRMGRTDLLLLGIGERILEGLAVSNPQNKIPGLALVAVEMFRPELENLLRQQLQPVNKKAKEALTRYHDARQSVESRLQERLMADLQAAAAAQAAQAAADAEAEAAAAAAADSTEDPQS